MEKKRLIEVTMISCAMVIISLVGIIATIFTNFKYVDLGAPLSLVLGIALFQLKQWARKGVIIFYILYVIYRILLIAMVIYKTFPAVLVNNIIMQMEFFIFPFIIIYFLTRPKVKEQFR